eukprot:UC4_evm4s1589
MPSACPPSSSSESLSPQERVLAIVGAASGNGNCNSVDTKTIATQLGVDHTKAVGVVNSLQSIEGLVSVEQKVDNSFVLIKEGLFFAEKGSHEFNTFQAVPIGDEGIPKSELDKAVGKSVAKFGLSECIKLGWLRLDKSGGGPPLVKRASDVEPPSNDLVQGDLLRIREGDINGVNVSSIEVYKRRKLIKATALKYLIVSKGPNFSLQFKKPTKIFTADMLKGGAWKDLNFEKILIGADGKIDNVGHLHPLLKVRSEFRQIFLEMGFEEMPTDCFVECSFWNFDALFQPQQHPARDAHDTFFLNQPASTQPERIEQNYFNRVKATHENGGDTGSQGYRNEWKTEEASKNILRTHTTAWSARMLYRTALEFKKTGIFTPKKYFSIDRVFRNETLDATHLAEFHQVEGLIMDKNLTLGDLCGTLDKFFRRLGMTKLRFKPAYNPYTEPSMEVFSYHEGLKKWVEIGNSGVFRPEMLLPMGFPKDTAVIAWGLSVERPTMIKYGFDNIRDLFGASVKLSLVQKSPIARLEK